jgi:hypothetical protein
MSRMQSLGATLLEDLCSSSARQDGREFPRSLLQCCLLPVNLALWMEPVVQSESKTMLLGDQQHLRGAGERWFLEISIQ